MANLDIIERESLCARARTLEETLVGALAPLADHELVEEVRGGTGVLAAVSLRHDLLADEPTLGAQVGAACRDHGMLVRPLVGGAVAVSPPLVIADDEVEQIAERFRAGLDAVAAR